MNKTMLIVTKEGKLWPTTSNKSNVPELVPSGLDDLGPTLPVDAGPFTHEELVSALKALSVGKAAGGDNIPPEFWKASLANAHALNELLKLCIACW